MHDNGDKLHVLPEGLLHGADARQAVARGLALPLAGEALAFTCAWLVHTCGKTGERARRLLSASALRRKAETNAALADWLQRLGAPRPAFAGIALDRPRIMGIVNVTPDSFSDGGQFINAQEAIDHARRLADAGADVLDVGGESTRPGAATVSVQEEMDRILPVIEALAADGHCVSVDTRKTAVMEAAVRAGARIVNDVSALAHDPQAAATVARLKVPVILMHMRGEPATMMQHAHYEDAALEVFDELGTAITRAERAGIARENIMIDPGIGFAKDTDHNLLILRRLALLHGHGLPLLYAASRKRFIGAITGVEEARKRLAGSLAVAQLAFLAGAHMVRVHDVRETAEMANMLHAVITTG